MSRPIVQAPSAAEIFGRDNVDDYPLTEAGAAERFAALHGDVVCYDHRRSRWLVWMGHRWAPNIDGSVTRIGLDFARAWQRTALDIQDRERREATFKMAIRLERREALASMLTFAQDFEPIADAGDRWDSEPFLLGVPNGVVDLRSGHLRPGRREDRITMVTSVGYNPDAQCPRWERFIAEVFAHDADLVSFVHRAIGYSLTGDVSEQVFLFCYGGGSNGKGTLLNLLRLVLGDYGHALPFSALEHDPRPGAASNELAALLGRRLTVSSESSEGRRLDEGRLKWLTGSDPIRARFLYAESFEFNPTSKFWLAANHKPIVHDDSHGFWRRVRLIPFTQTFDVTTEPDLPKTLAGEAEGILAWAVRGALQWQREGLQAPAVVLAAVADYRRDSDPLAGFVDAACDVIDGAEVGASDLFHHYVTWAKAQGLTEREQLSATKFGRKASDRFEHQTRRDGKVYLGVSRRPL